MTKKMSVEDRLEALEAESRRDKERLASLEKENQRLRQSVVEFPAGTTVGGGVQHVEDASRVIGLKPGLYPYQPDKGGKGVCGEAYAIQRGYRKATPADFVDNPTTYDGEQLKMTAQEAFDLAMSSGLRAMGHALYVTSMENRQRLYAMDMDRAAAASGKESTPHHKFVDPKTNQSVLVTGPTHGMETKR